MMLLTAVCYLLSSIIKERCEIQEREIRQGGVGQRTMSKSKIKRKMSIVDI